MGFTGDFFRVFEGGGENLNSGSWCRPTLYKEPLEIKHATFGHLSLSRNSNSSNPEPIREGGRGVSRIGKVGCVFYNMFFALSYNIYILLLNYFAFVF